MTTGSPAKMLLAATLGDKQIYFIVNPDSVDSHDGVVVGDAIEYVQFWPYVTRFEVSRIKTLRFLRKLWEGSPQSEQWDQIVFQRTRPIPKKSLKEIGPFLIDVPKSKQPSNEGEDDLFQNSSAKSDQSIIQVKAERSPQGQEEKGLAMQRTRVKALRRKLIPEPYDPNARDGDNDGIVQEGTAWERPAGTRFLKPDGKPFRSGAEANDRPSLFKLVDADDNEVEYTPTYDRDTTSRLGQTVGQRQRTVGEAAQPAPARRVIRRPLKQEKYNPYLEPNDDGILQEGTIWERPVGTYFLDRAGNRVKPWDNRRTRPILFDESTNKPSDYVPTYERPDYVPPSDATTPKPIDKNKNWVFGYYTPGEKYDQKEVAKKARLLKGEIDGNLATMVEELSDEELMKAREALKLLPSLDVDASRGWNDRSLLRAALVDHLTDEVAARVVDYVNDRRRGDLYIAVPASAVSAILRARRMKSQFETGTSNGMFSPEIRRRTELELMSVPGDLPDGLRPIYGFQLNEDFEGDSPTRSNAAEQYGVVVFQLKRSVRERTTMTNADSLDYQTHPIPVDGEVSEDRILASVGYNDFEVGDAINGTISNFRQDVLGDDSEGDVRYGYGIGYSEIQVHGGVDLADIEQVIYPSSGYSLDVTDRERIIRELDRAGIDHREDW